MVCGYTNALFILLFMNGLAVRRNTIHISVGIKYVHIQQRNGFKCFPSIIQLVLGGIIEDKFPLISTGQGFSK